MSLVVGTRLGAYEILSPLGAGGMGEVYRARDAKLNRDVALKILPEALAADAVALARFEREAQAVAALSHPNILAIHDFGVERGTPYAVMELLEGQTLRDQMSGAAVPPRKAVEYALQIAAGLAAAHARGITHRDLKPENVFVTRDGHVKILDFGLAKQRPAASADATVAATRNLETGPGMALGTVGYMAPEQLRGQDVDHRSDIFAFGAVLYEMLAGRRAFQGATPADTASAVLKEDPPELTATSTAHVPPSLDRIVRRCLEKNPDERFQSTRDVAFALEAISGSGSGAGPALAVSGAEPASRVGRRRLALVAIVATCCIGVALAAGYLVGTRAAGGKAQRLTRLTFDRGTIRTARFTPDGKTVIYGAAWNGEPLKMFQTRLGSPESIALPLPASDVLAISASGEMAISVGRQFNVWVSEGMLARTPPVGNSYKEVLDHVSAADWSPDGTALAIVRRVDGKDRLEYPIGRVLYETTGYVSHPRVSPSGDAVAFLDHPVYNDNRGSVALVTTGGEKKTLTPEWSGEEGLAWSAAGDEIWFTGGDANDTRLRGVTRTGRAREIWSVPSELTILDVAPDGRALVTVDTTRTQTYWVGPGDAVERDISWMSWAEPRSITADGRGVLFSRYDAGAGRDYEVGLRRIDASSAVRLGSGEALQFSPDGTRALALVYSAPRQLMVLPTGAGEPRSLTVDGFDYVSAGWHPDGRRVIFVADRQGQPLSAYIQDAAGGAPTRLGVALGRFDPRIRNWGSLLISPDGKWFTGSEGPPTLLAVDGSGPRAFPTLGDADFPVGWTGDGRGLFVSRPGSTAGATEIVRVDLASGAIMPWKEIVPRDAAGLTTRVRCHLTPDGRTIVYSASRYLTDLYLVEGLK
jgi:Tol biopolymer transport system component/tRNA A-37 threonylcarbamoyl transferase component Bud32